MEQREDFIVKLGGELAGCFDEFNDLTRRTSNPHYRELILNNLINNYRFASERYSAPKHRDMPRVSVSINARSARMPEFSVAFLNFSCTRRTERASMKGGKVHRARFAPRLDH